MFKKILVPTDGSTLAQSAATTAAQLAKSQGAQVVGVYVIDPFPYIGIGDASAVGLQAYMAEARSAAGQALEALGKVCELDPDDRFGAARLIAVADRHEKDLELESEEAGA